MINQYSEEEFSELAALVNCLRRSRQEYIDAKENYEFFLDLFERQQDLFVNDNQTVDDFKDTLEDLSNDVQLCQQDVMHYNSELSTKYYIEVVLT